jgi:hypothetical protein
MPYSRPRQAEPPPIWICRICQKLMRIRTIEVSNGEEQTKLACAACGTEATQTKKVLSEPLAAQSAEIAPLVSSPPAG